MLQTLPIVVTVSGAFGTGSELVAREVADRLGVGFMDRAISKEVAADLATPLDEIDSVEEDLGSGLSHWIAFFASGGAAWGGIVPPEVSGWTYDEASYKSHLEAVLVHEAERGAVILGRGGAIALRDHPGALHVRLDGPVERRIARAIELGGLDEHPARDQQHTIDSARHHYVRRLYHADVADHRLYHLNIDATAVPRSTCVDLIVTAARGREEQWRTDAKERLGD